MSIERCMIWGAGYCGGVALAAYGFDKVICFGDSDERNVGLIRWEKPIISYNEMILRAKKENIRIIAASEDYLKEMENKLIEESIDNYDLFVCECTKDIIADRKLGIDILSKKYYPKVKPEDHDELKKFYKIHDKQRIFLVGNGPSLRSEDLEVLYCNNEICFGFNGIYNIFNRTNWRPDYYGIADYYGFLNCQDDLKKVPGIHFMWDLFSAISSEIEDDPQNYLFRFIRKGYSSDNMPDFSDDITKGVCLGYSVTYDIGLQIAAYMGASEIYLIGMDHYQPNKKSYEGNHFEGYLQSFKLEEKQTRFYPAENYKKGYDTERVEKAFEKAEIFSKEHGFRIYNSTRGGKLEVFERVNFDSLFM